MRRRKNRSRSKISRLPSEIRSTVDAMIQATADFTYKDIQAYLAEQNVDVSQSAIGTYARNLMESLEALNMAQESIRAMMDTASKIPEVDAVEIINRIAGQKLVQAIISKPEEEWTELRLDKLLKEANGMTKAVAYKQRIDLQNKEDVEAAADELKAEFFAALSAENPELYRQVVQALNRQVKGMQDNGMVCTAGADRPRTERVRDSAP